MTRQEALCLLVELANESTLLGSVISIAKADGEEPADNKEAIDQNDLIELKIRNLMISMGIGPASKAEIRQALYDHSHSPGWLGKN